MKISDIRLNAENPRYITEKQFEKIVKSVKEFPEMMKLRPIVIDVDNVIVGGNMRYRALLELGYTEIPDEWVIEAKDLTPDQIKRFIIADNLSFGEWDKDILANEWDTESLMDWGFEFNEMQDIEDEIKSKKLSDRFIIPPLSILDCKQGCWVNRKNYWLSLGIKSETGRDGDLVRKGLANLKRYNEKTEIKGTSIFDPVLCELSYKWFNIPNGKILDPFAGGSVRGIVASKLGYNYLGNDLRQEQIDANITNAKEVLQDGEKLPKWTCGDSLNIDTIAKDYNADMIFTCPPYADLEVYSDLKEDISNMPYEEFLIVYREIIKKSCSILKYDRFAVVVVGDIRDKKGFYQNFVSDTIQAFIDSGMKLYNEMILATQIGALALNAGNFFNASRKISKVHQNILVFYKGNPKNIKTNYPELDLSYLQEMEENI